MSTMLKRFIVVIVFLAGSSMVWSSSIPKDLTYKVINSSRIVGIKCSLDVRLSQKVSKDTLRVLAIRLRDAQPRRYERMFICYYLPGMTAGTGAWATSHFNPDLKVHILGLTAEEEQKLKLTAQSGNKSSQTIGIWLDETPYIAGKTTIRREKDTIVMVQEFKDGRSQKLEMVESRKSGLRKYKQKGEDQFGEYYIIDSSGNLKVYDREGLIKTLRPIR